MRIIKIHFHNTEYDFITPVSELATEEGVRDYFVGQWFNMGQGEEDNMRQCIAVSIIDK